MVRCAAKQAQRTREQLSEKSSMAQDQYEQAKQAHERYVANKERELKLVEKMGFKERMELAEERNKLEGFKRRGKSKDSSRDR